MVDRREKISGPFVDPDSTQQWTIRTGAMVTLWPW